MKVKNKLFLSLLFLFGVIILLGGMGGYYLRRLARDSAAIMKDNNRTLSYMRNIEEAVDELHFLSLSGRTEREGIDRIFSSIESLIRLQQSNITEPGEQDLSAKLEKNLTRLKKSYISWDTIPMEKYLKVMAPLIHEIKVLTASIYLINEKTMIRKNEQANATAEKTVFYMSIFGLIGILVSLFFIIGLPIYISRPLTTFNEAIRQIANGNYKVKIPLQSRDEYGDLANSFNKMASELDAYKHTNLAKLLKEQKRLNAVINQMDEVILGLDENKLVIFANKHCLRLLKLEKQQVLGKYAPDIAIRNRLMSDMIREVMESAIPPQEKGYSPVKVAERGKEKLFSKNIIDVSEKQSGWKEEAIFGHVVIMTDITDFAEKDKAKTHFMATLSHELKTPVSAIRMSANLLRNKKSGLLSDEQQELVETIDNNNSRIRRIINEILDMSSIESGTIGISISNVSVPEIIERTIEGVQLFLKDKELTIKKALPPGLPEIRVDAHKVVWVLNNFLTNAIRYAPEGSAIEVKAESDGDQVLIEITDQGPGISPENQKKIFQKFTRLVNSERTGTGLGLAISKEFVEAMDGSIGVHSEEGAGATFWIKCVVA